MTAYISRDDSYALEHHGVKGMKWGVRKEKKRKEREKRKAARRFEQNYEKNFIQTYNRAADRMDPEIKRINKKYANQNLASGYENWTVNGQKTRFPVYNEIGKKYLKEMNDSWRKIYSSQIESEYGVHPSKGKKWYEDHITTMKFMSMYEPSLYDSYTKKQSQ